MGLQLSDIEAAQQLQPLLMTQHNEIVRPTHGPLELVALQTFLPEHETGLVPGNHLELASLFIAAGRQSAVDGRCRHLILDNDAKAVARFSNIHRRAVQVDLNVLGPLDHTAIALTSCAMACTLPAGIFTVTAP